MFSPTILSFILPTITRGRAPRGGVSRKPYVSERGGGHPFSMNSQQSYPLSWPSHWPRTAHPDNGGSHEAQVALNAAWDQARQAFKVGV